MAIITKWTEFGIEVERVRTSPEVDLTQVELGKKAGVSQSVVSNVERGGKIKQKAARKIATFLQIRTKAFEGVEDKRALAIRKLAYCSFTKCPSLIFSVNDGELYIKPRFITFSASHSGRCRYCGCELSQECPNPDCAAPVVSEVLRCATCNEALVEVPESLTGISGIDLVEQCDNLNKQNARLRYEQA